MLWGLSIQGMQGLGASEWKVGGGRVWWARNKWAVYVEKMCTFDTRKQNDCSHTRAHACGYFGEQLRSKAPVQ